MAGRYGKRFMKDEDFEEGEVWGMMEERENNSSPRLRKPMKKDPSSLSLSPSSATTKPRMIPKSSSNSTIVEAHPHQSKQFSAPLDIPDWSKIYGKSSSRKKGSNNYNFATPSSPSWGVHHHHYDHDDHDGDGDGDDDDDDVYGVVPPHEYLAKKLARSQISSFSVYEGIGRTLKGRDLSKVRNAVLTKTGFLES